VPVSRPYLVCASRPSEQALFERSLPPPCREMFFSYYIFFCLSIYSVWSSPLFGRGYASLLFFSATRPAAPFSWDHGPANAALSPVFLSSSHVFSHASANLDSRSSFSSFSWGVGCFSQPERFRFPGLEPAVDFASMMSGDRFPGGPKCLSLHPDFFFSRVVFRVHTSFFFPKLLLFLFLQVVIPRVRSRPSNRSNNPPLVSLRPTPFLRRLLVLLPADPH